MFIFSAAPLANASTNWLRRNYRTLNIKQAVWFFLWIWFLFSIDVIHPRWKKLMSINTNNDFCCGTSVTDNCPLMLLISFYIFQFGAKKKNNEKNESVGHAQAPPIACNDLHNNFLFCKLCAGSRQLNK